MTLARSRANELNALRKPCSELILNLTLYIRRQQGVKGIRDAAIPFIEYHEGKTLIVL
jgi:hypothetical protein